MFIEGTLHEQSGYSNVFVDSLFARITQLEKDLREEKKNSCLLATKNSFYRKELIEMEKGLKKFFGDDQIQALTKKKIKGWSNATVKKAVTIKNTVGKKFFNFIRTNVAPFPSARILQRRVELSNANDFLCNSSEADPVLATDEVQMLKRVMIYNN